MQLNSSYDGPKVILIADDLRWKRDLMHSMVLSMLLKPVVATNGREAVELFEKEKPDLVLMDVLMPEMNGMEAAVEIKKLAGDRFLPIIFVSGADEPSAIEKAIDAGGDDFLQWPFPVEILSGKIKAFGRIARIHHQIQRLNEERDVEQEVAEQILSRAVSTANMARDEVSVFKRSAALFSGDIQLSAYRPNGDLNVLIGDFTGHGLASTIGALPLSETFKAMTAKGYEAGEILDQINQKLNRLLPVGKFLAAAMVTIDKTGTARIWNGGIPDVLVFANKEVKHRVVSSQPPLGILRQMAKPKFELLKLSAADQILMLSDGVLEAEGKQQELYGEERLLSVVQNATSDNLIEVLSNDLAAFMAGQRVRDDITLVSLAGNAARLREEPVVSPSANNQASVQALSSDFGEEWRWGIQLHDQHLQRVNPVALAMSYLREMSDPSFSFESVFTILTELYLNALDHGVLGLDSSIKATPDGFARYFQEREQRLSNLKGGSVSLNLMHIHGEHGGRLVIKVCDSGPGFDYLPHIMQDSGAPVVHDGLSGRGIQVVRNLCEKLEYSQNGACVEASFDYDYQTGS